VSSLAGIRWAVRATLCLGVAASVAANILHARANPISQTIAAWSPLALLATVELISRVPVRRKGIAVLRLGVTGALAGIAAWVSYWHMVSVAARYGETGASPYLLPFSVDGLIVVASISLLELAARNTDDAPPVDETPAVDVPPAAGPDVTAPVSAAVAPEPAARVGRPSLSVNGFAPASLERSGR
jgi:hypothetical protein